MDILYIVVWQVHSQTWTAGPLEACEPVQDPLFSGVLRSKGFVAWPKATERKLAISAMLMTTLM